MKPDIVRVTLQRMHARAVHVVHAEYAQPRMAESLGDADAVCVNRMCALLRAWNTTQRGLAPDGGEWVQMKTPGALVLFTIRYPRNDEETIAGGGGKAKSKDSKARLYDYTSGAPRLCLTLQLQEGFHVEHIYGLTDTLESKHTTFDTVYEKRGDFVPPERVMVPIPSCVAEIMYV